MAIETFFINLTSKGPALLLGENFYLTSSNIQDKYLEFNNSGARLGLVPAGKLTDLVKFYEYLNKDKIQNLKKEYIEEKVEPDLQYEDVKKGVGKEKLFKFIVKELMPFLSGHKEDISELLGEKIKDQKIKEAEDKKINEKEVLKALNEAKANLRKEQKKEYKDRFVGDINNEAKYFKDLLKKNDIITFGEKIYALEHQENESELTLVIDGKIKNFRLKPFDTIHAIETNYSEFLEWKSKLRAIDEFSDYIKEKQEIKLAAIKDFGKIMQLKEFNDGDVGFLQKDGTVYIYQILHPFAMLDPRPTQKEQCYEFPKLRVGMIIEYDNGEFYLRDPVLFEPTWHPFVNYKDVPFQKICGGNIPSKGNYSQVEWIAKTLDDAKNIIMNGLTPKSIIQHGGDTERGGAYFGDSLDEKLAPRKTTVKEAKKKCLIITNKWKWEDG